MILLNRSLKQWMANLLIFLILIQMSKNFLLILSAYLPEGLKVLTTTPVFYIILIVTMVLYWVLCMIDRVYVNLWWMLAFVSILLIIVITTKVHPSFSYSHLYGILLQVVSNILMLYLLFMICFSPTKEVLQLKNCYFMCLVFVIVQSFFGILQYLTNSTLFPMEIGGKQVSKNLFYSQGSSSANEQILSAGGHVRAIGLTNSSLTLGLFMLFGIVLALYMKSKFWKSFLILLFSATVFMTLTRVIWVTWLFLIILLFLPGVKNNYKLQMILSDFFWLMQVLIAFFPTLLSRFQNNPFFATLLSRFNGLQFFLQQFPIKFANLFIGQNFSVRLIDIKTFGLSLDNQFLVYVLNLGLFSFFIYYLLNRFIVNKIFKTKDKNIGKLLLVLPIVGIVNDPSYFVFGVLLICKIFMNNSLRFATKVEH